MVCWEECVLLQCHHQREGVVFWEGVTCTSSFLETELKPWISILNLACISIWLFPHTHICLWDIQSSRFISVLSTQVCCSLHFLTHLLVLLVALAGGPLLDAVPGCCTLSRLCGNTASREIRSKIKEWKSISDNSAQSLAQLCFSHCSGCIWNPASLSLPTLPCKALGQHTHLPIACTRWWFFPDEYFQGDYKSEWDKLQSKSIPELAARGWREL